MSKPRLVILSDIYGLIQPDWVNDYINLLSPHFEVQYYDSRVLGGVDLEIRKGEEIHHQFIDFGLKKAVNTLLRLEKRKITLLGFSIGGTLAWQAALKGLNTSALFAVSSTRLRLEIHKPEIPIFLSYGENDQNKPRSKWFDEMSLKPEINHGQGHNFYREAAYAKQLVEVIKRKALL